MANEKGNFRLPYYEKCGFRSEEKKSLEIILKEKPLDRIKLQNFCLNCSVPLTHRNLVWKLLLEVIPLYPDSHEFVMEQRTLEYTELVRALQTIRYIDASTPKSNIFYAVWLLQKGSLLYGITFRRNEEEQFILLANVFSQRFDNETDVYWLTKMFYEYIKKYRNDYPKLIERVWVLLEKEDKELYWHLQNTYLKKLLPIEKWFDSAFAGILNDNALVKIWDKICGGSFKILVFVTICLLTILRHDIMKCKKLPSILDVLNNIPEEIAELIVCKSIEMWQKHGSPKNINTIINN